VNEKKRYFEVQGSSEGEEIDVVADEGESSSEGNTDIDALVPDTPVLPESPNFVRLDDSSVDDSDIGEEEEELHAPGTSLDALPRAVPSSQPSVLSTFHPVLDKNLFHVSVNEISHLNLTDRTEEALVMLILDPEQTLALLGTYTFIVVVGRIWLSGVAISASRTSHRVFAPRSSPVPILRALERGAETETTQRSYLPDRFQSFSRHDGAIVILQGAKTGVEGLGRVFKTFDGVFEPSRLSHLGSPSLLLPDVHLV
jgi:polynucleotide 5'-hydroxyl-kinase GRC3/NOL9